MEARCRPLVLLGVLAIGCGSSDESTFFEDSASSDAASTTAGLTPVDTTTTGASDDDSAQSTASGTTTTAESATTSTSVGGATNTGGSGGAISGTSSDGAVASGGIAGTGDAGIGTGGGPAGSGGATSSAGSGGADTGGVGGNAGSGGSTSATGGVGGGTVPTSGSIPVDGTVTVQETCDFYPCGGDLEGQSFEYVGACIEEQALLGSYTDTCEGLEVVAATGTIEGTISFANGRFAQDVSLDLSVEYHVPRRCLYGSYGANCTLAAAAFSSAGAVGTRCESASGGGCNCTRPISSPASTSGRYTTRDDELTLGGTTVSYCASRGTLQYTNSLDDWDYVIQATNP